MEGTETLALTLGVGLTTNETVRVLMQPNALAPMTVYTVVPAGLTVGLAPLRLPGFQVYVAAPVPVRVATKPGQIAVGLAVAPSTGGLLTIMVNVFMSSHAEVRPVKVYTVVTVGDTTIVVAV